MTPEQSLQRLVLDWLQAKQILAFRMQTGATLSSYGGKKRMIRYGVPGMADILAWRRHPTMVGYSQAIWIELKAPEGRQTELQKSFQKQIEAQGHKYILARSLEDIEAVLI